MSKPKTAIAIVSLKYPWAAILSENYNDIPVDIEMIKKDVNDFLGFVIKGGFSNLGVSTYDSNEKRIIDVVGGMEFYHDDKGVTIKDIKPLVLGHQRAITSFISTLLLISGAANEIKKDKEFSDEIIGVLEKIEGLNKDIVLSAVSGTITMQENIRSRIKDLIDSDEGFEKDTLREIVKEQLEICFGVKKQVPAKAAYYPVIEKLQTVQAEAREDI